MKKYISIILLFIVCLTTNAETKLTAKNKLYERGYNFWLYEPDYDTISFNSKNDSLQLLPQPIPFDSLSAEEIIAQELMANNQNALSPFQSTEPRKKPLIIFLHGRSLCGNNLNKVLRYGTIDAVKGGRKIDAFIIAPQNPGTFWEPDKIMAIADWACENYPIDNNRIYVLGMSLGGYGTIDLVATHPNRIAAAMALCGGGSRKDLSGLNEVPLWIIHGTADRAVSVNESRKVRNQMKEAGETPLLRYDEWAGINHGALARLFYLENTYEWLFKHTLDNRTVDKSISITQSDTKNAYKGFKHRSSSKNKSKAKKKSKRNSTKKSN